MPPKTKKKKTGVIIDGVDTAPMSRDELEAFVRRIREENGKIKEERNLFQLERDQQRTSWEITRNELEETRAKLRNRDRQIQEQAEKQVQELRFYRQQVKNLQHEHQSDHTSCKSKAMGSLRNTVENHSAEERNSLRIKRELKGITK